LTCKGEDDRGLSLGFEPLLFVTSRPAAIRSGRVSCDLVERFGGIRLGDIDNAAMGVHASAYKETHDNSGAFPRSQSVTPVHGGDECRSHCQEGITSN